MSAPRDTPLTITVQLGLLTHDKNEYGVIVLLQDKILSDSIGNNSCWVVKQTLLINLNVK